jgi:hypothetical protein
MFVNPAIEPLVLEVNLLHLVDLPFSLHFHHRSVHFVTDASTQNMIFLKVGILNFQRVLLRHIGVISCCFIPDLTILTDIIVVLFIFSNPVLNLELPILFGY